MVGAYASASAAAAAPAPACDAAVGAAAAAAALAAAAAATGAAAGALRATVATPPSAAATADAAPGVAADHAPDDGRWRSPFAHGEGSSWHSGSSVATLFFFCYLDLVVIALCVLGVHLHARSLRRTAIVAATLISFTAWQHYMGIIIFETLIGRPWIWLIMT